VVEGSLTAVMFFQGAGNKRSKMKTMITCCRWALLPFWLELLGGSAHIRKISKAFKLSFPSSATIYSLVNNHYIAAVPSFDVPISVQAHGRQHCLVSRHFSL